MQRGELSGTELQKIVDDKLSEKIDEAIAQGYKVRFPEQNSYFQKTAFR